MNRKPNATTNWVREGYSVGERNASEIAEAFGVNKEWILTGEGEMLNNSGNISGTVFIGNKADNGSTQRFGNITINNNKREARKTDKESNIVRSYPLIPIEAVAGFGKGDNDGIRYEDCDQYTVPDFERMGMEFLIRVSGSSMYPKYSNGDVLACKKIREIVFFQWGKVYVIDSSQGILVKRIFEDKSNQDCILCVSDNKEKYPPFSIPKSDIRSLSIVIGVVRVE